MNDDRNTVDIEKILSAPAPDPAAAAQAASAAARVSARMAAELAVTKRGLVRLAFPEEHPDSVL